MAKKLNTVSVNMQFNADTKQAKKQVEDLQNSLTRLISSPMQINVDPSKIREATIATAELQSHLKNATNVDTGNLDFGKLSQSLKKSGKSLQEYGNTLRSLGPEGQQAFMKLAQAVVSAEVPIRRTNALVKEFATTLANTARWQLSSSVLHGFMGALQSAYGYAQDLNESLNNIRIVTGRSVDDMADFAKEANKAAKALSTTTTKYTDASLIYYQQGLKDADVKKRADVTVKLANVSRQSAEEVSNQMTAVWNNFYDGSKSLEHYADVMTALGAATASSTEEIAGGLEKFAAVADTIGLSYEYAASALATITSNTRQSEEVVGTALKTIFARIQGLNLGETLEDGTTLNKYSEALNKVGINIYDTNGQLKDMDTILNNLGSRWNQLGKDQQVALAQTVAGVRQYNQLIALMDNWNKGDSDSFMANLATANNSSGALNKQADIYAESWEAASDRVTAAAEAIYKSLINDEFFIDLLNNVEKLLGFINNLIEGLGGLKGVLFTLGTVITKVFSQQLSQGLTNLAYNLKMSTESGRKQVQQEKSDFIKDAADKMAKAANTGEAGYDQKMAAKIYEQQLERQQELIDNADKMSEIEKDTAKRLMDQLKLRDELAIKSAAELQSRKDALADSASLIYTRGANLAAEKHKKYNSALITEEMTKVKAGVAGVTELQELFASGNNINEDSIAEVFKKINGDTSKGWNIVSASQIKEVRTLSQGLKGLEQDTEAYQAQLNAISGVMGRVNEQIQEHASTITGASVAEIKNYAKNVDQVAKATKEKNKATEESKKINQDLKNTIKNAKGAQQSWSDTLVAGANAAMSFASALSMIGGIWDTLQNPDLSGWQKFTTVLTTLGMLIPTLITTWESLQKLIKSETFEKIKNVAATIAQTIAERKLNKEKGEGTEKTKKSIKETVADTKEKLKNTGSKIKEKVSGGWGKIKDTWNQKAYEVQGGKLNKNGTSTLKGRSGIVTKAETQTLMSNAGKGALKSAVGYVGGALVAAALVAAAVAAYKKLDSVLNKNELAARRAAKAAQNLADAYAKASQEYDNLLNTMSNYDNAKKSLEELTKGTVEFSKAVQDANVEAMKLIENYSDIIGTDYSVDANGLIQIDDKAMQRIKEKEYADLQQAQITSSIANREAREARIAADMTKLNREKIKSQEDLMTNEDWAGTGKGAAVGQGIGAVAGLGVGIGMAATGASIGAAAGSVVPVVGTLIGAAAGIIIGGVTGAVVNAIDKNSETDKEKEAFQKLEEAYREKGEMVFEDSQIKEMFPTSEFGNLADELINNKEAVKDLVKEMAANTSAIEAENRAMANSILANNKNVTSSRHGVEIVSAFGGEVYGKEKDRLYDEYLAKASDRGIFATRTKQSKEIIERYAEVAGLNDLKDFKITNYKDDGSFDYKYKDENGKWVKNNNVTAEDVAFTLAGKDVVGKVNEAGDKIVSILDNVEDREAKILAGAKSKDMSNLTISELSSNAKANLSSLSEADLQTLGFEGDKNTILDNIQAQLEANKSDIQNFAKVQSLAIGQMFGEILSGYNKAFGNVSQGALKQYADTLSQIQASSNQQATTQFNSGMSQLLSQYSHKADEITQIVNSIDWTKGDAALSEFNYQLLQMGINVDEGGEAWEDLATAISNIHLSVLDQDLNAVRNSLAEISKLTKDLDLGSIISDEDYKKLIKYNAELEKYFIMTADGYKYIGGADINSIIEDSHETQLNNIIEGNNKARAAASAFSNVQSGGKTEDWYGLANGTDDDAKISAMASTLAGDFMYTDHIESLGWSTDWIKKQASVLNNSSSTIEQKNAARDELKKFYQDIITLQDKTKAGDYDDDKAHEIIASGMSLNELQNSDYIKQEVKNKIISYLQEATEADRDVFREVNKELEEIQHNLSLIDKLKESAYGPDKLDLIENEVKLLQNQTQTLKENKELIGTELNNNKTKLSNNYSWLRFDAEGNIANYDDLYKYLSEDKWEAAKKAFGEYEDLQNKAEENELNLLDLHNEIQAKMLETYDAADEALDKYTEKLEHHINILGHYKDLLVLTGKAVDYDTLDLVLKGEASVFKSTLTASTKEYEMYNNEVARWAKEMSKVKKGSEEWKTYNQNWEEAQTKARDAQDKMLSDLQAWAESEKAILENTLADLGEELEKALTGGLSFDQLNTSMERAASLQEEYLTSTNQIYETTKLMRVAQQEIDKSTSSIIKSKMKSFINETKALQNQGKLSKFELEIQQAKYDLLVAEIALEEAQNAKNTVRLQRDSEGNFGYVYTADVALVNESLQQFDDAQNALYNKGLEGANNYAQKYQSTLQEMSSSLNEIQTNYLNGMYESEEEYHNAILATKNYYYQKLNDYSKLYSIAIEADSEIAATAWSTEFNSMIKSAEEWKTNVDTYLDGSGQAFTRWQGVIEAVHSAIGGKGGTLDSLSTAIGKITIASSNLVASLTGKEGLIAQLKTGFGEVAKTIKEAIDEFKGLSFDVSIKANKDNNNSNSPKPEIDNNASGESDADNEPSNEKETGYIPGQPNPSGKVEDELTNQELIKKYNIQNPDNYRIIAGKIYSGFTKEDGFFINVAPKWEHWNEYSTFEKAADAWFKAHYIGPATLDTGGYTGEWGPEGKLAVLHEKEIVLNQQDTANLLMTMNMLDSILATLDSYTSNWLLGGGLQSPGYGSIPSENLEQNVHIEASFPAVTNHSEIEEAFNNLVNRASQYANRK